MLDVPEVCSQLTGELGESTQLLPVYCVLCIVCIVVRYSHSYPRYLGLLLLRSAVYLCDLRFAICDEFDI